MFDDGSLNQGLLGIGEMARASGLPVSALRFYDGAGLLVPLQVDPSSGYRRYGPDQVAAARLLARLRRVGMPLADMRVLVAGRHDRALVGALVAEHLARLEAGLADARSELEYVMTETDPSTPPAVTAFRVAAADLRHALDAVRFALPADADDHTPTKLDAPAESDAVAVLNTVLFDVDDTLLTLVATDRHRMAVSAVPVTDRSGPSARLCVPRAELNRIAALTADPLDARIDGDMLHLADLTLTAHPGQYPAYRMMTSSVGGQAIPADAAELRAMLADGPVHTVPDTPGEIAALGLDPTGALRVVDPVAPGFVAAVNRGYLLDALNAAPTGQLVLDLDGPLHPLAIRHPTDPGTYSVLMPVRLP